MNTQLLDKATKEYKKVKHPDFRVGDIIEVHTKIKEAGKERVQIFEGIVLSIKGSGMSKMFTVRKISYGVGVEKIFPYYSPVIEKIKIVKTSKVKKSKLYYLRNIVGKRALKAGIQIPAVGEDLESRYEEELQEKEAEEATKEEETNKVTKEDKSKETENKKESKKEKKSEKQEKNKKEQVDEKEKQENKSPEKKDKK